MLNNFATIVLFSFFLIFWVLIIGVLIAVCLEDCYSLDLLAYVPLFEWSLACIFTSSCILNLVVKIF